MMLKMWWMVGLMLVVPAMVLPDTLDIQQQDVYSHYSLVEICGRIPGEKQSIFLNTDVSVFTFNSSDVMKTTFLCHLELEVKNSNYGFSVFIEEMQMSGSIANCRDDYLQFGRDILFVTSHRSIKYCGEVEPPVPISSQGMTKFDFPYTPLVRRIYTEEVDKDMDVWLRVVTPDQDNVTKSLTLVVTPFKKFCGSSDQLYRQCRYSTKCVRRELFCDGRVNCAWPYAEPADEVYCKDLSVTNQTVWSSWNIPVLVVVGVVVLGAVTLLCLAIAKITRKVKKFQEYYNEDGGGGGCHDSVNSTDPALDYPPPLTDYRPSCPPPPPSDFLPSCPPDSAPSCPPNPYTASEPRIGYALSAAVTDHLPPPSTDARMFRPPPPYSPPRTRSNQTAGGQGDLAAPSYQQPGQDDPPCYSTLVQNQT